MFLRVVGRLREGVSFDAARAEVIGVAAQISRESTDYGSAGRAFTVVGFQSDGVRAMRPVLLALFGGVVTLLLVAIVNVAGLLVARAAARARESAVQVALGASRARMFSQYLAEGAVLSIAGAAAGVITALAGVRLLLLTRPENLGRIDNTSVDIGVLAVTATIAVGVALIFSLAPMSEMLRSRPVTALQHGARGGGAQTHRRVRSVLVVVQLALAVVLLVSAALFVRTFRALQLVDPGFRAEGVLSFRIGLPPRLFGKQEVFNAFSREFQSKLAALPGITHVGAISHLPYDNVPNWSTNYLIHRGEDDSQARRADARAVTPGFFEAAGARLVAGRAFTEQDDNNSRPVAIVDETLARRVWPAGDAVGKEIAVDPRVTGHPNVWVTIVGVVAHMRHLSLTEEVREQVYFPVRQAPRNPMAYMVRTRADAASLTTQVRAALDTLDPQVPIYDVRPLGDSVATAMATQRFTMRLASVFAFVALCMACVGVYGVMAYSVAKRRVEFGVRLALGARPHAVVALVVREGARLAVAGLFLGIVAAFNVTTMLASQLYGVTARDIASYVAVVPVLAVAAIAACWLPALRATRANPIDALRAE
jgi:predicted permease